VGEQLSCTAVAQTEFISFREEKNEIVGELLSCTAAASRRRRLPCQRNLRTTNREEYISTMKNFFILISIVFGTFFSIKIDWEEISVQIFEAWKDPKV
jgi:hypothetical protein